MLVKHNKLNSICGINFGPFRYNMQMCEPIHISYPGTTISAVYQFIIFQKLIIKRLNGNS